jgi:hypothetical protein
MPGIVKYVGETGWAKAGELTEVQIERAILRSKNEIVIECHVEGYRYTATLHRHGGNEFSGGFTATSGNARIQGEINCKIVLSGGEGLILGTWNEEGESFRWWASLDEIHKFPDEKSPTKETGQVSGRTKPTS